MLARKFPATVHRIRFTLEMAAGAVRAVPPHVPATAVFVGHYMVVPLSTHHDPLLSLLIDRGSAVLDQTSLLNWPVSRLVFFDHLRERIEPRGGGCARRRFSFEVALDLVKSLLIVAVGPYALIYLPRHDTVSGLMRSYSA